MRINGRRILVALLFAAVPARADVYDKLAKSLIRGVPGIGAAKAAVLPFAYADGRSSPGGRIVAEGLSNAIAEQTRGVLVERSQIDKMMAEMSLGATGAVSSTTAVQAGRLIGAKYLVVGTLEEISDTSVEVRARLIEAESGIVQSQARGEVKRTWREGEVPLNAPPPIKVTEVSVRPTGPEQPLVERFGERTVRIEYSNSDDRPVLRLTDVTDARRPESVEVELPFDAHRNKFYDMSGRRAKLHGRRYLVWSGVWKENRGPTLHIAPLKGFWTDATSGDLEMIVDFMDLVGRWVKQVEKRGEFLGSRDNLELVAYFDRLEDKRLRVSLWTIQGPGRVLSPYPGKFMELQGRHGAETSSNVIAVGTRHFRFRYDFDGDRVKVEEL